MSKTPEEQIAAYDRKIAQTKAAKRDCLEKLKSKERNSKTRRWLIYGRSLEASCGEDPKRLASLNLLLRQAKLSDKERQFLGLPPVATQAAESTSGISPEATKSAV